MVNKLDTLLTACAEAYHAENEVISRLTATAEKYLAAIGAILGFHLVELNAINFSRLAENLGFSFVVLTGLTLLLASLGVTLWSMFIREYPTFPVTKDLAPLRDAGVSDEEAKSSLIDVYLDLRDGILRVNERRAKLVRVSGILLLLGFFMSIVGQFGMKFL
jgi:hypothetical protein